MSILARVGLLFDDQAEEEAFANSFARGNIRQTQAAMLLGGFVYYIFYIWDRVIDPAGWEATHLIRSAVVVLVLFPAAILLQFPAFRRRVETVLLVYAAVPSVALALIYAILDRGFDYGAEGLVIVILFVFTLLPIRIVFFALFCVMSWGSFAFSEAVVGNAQPGMALVNHLCIGTSVFLGLYSAISREISARRQFTTARELDKSRFRVEELLHSILPRDIAARIQAGESVIADSYSEVSIVVADLVGFTELSRLIEPARLVDLLNRLFSSFDEEAEHHGIEKIKTIGDAYLAVGGLSGPARDHVERSALFSLALHRSVERLSHELGLPMSVRVGLHVGPVVAGVIGTNRPAFDCWGDTVNLASRLETAAPPGGVLVSEAAYQRLRGRFAASRLDEVVLKGIGPATVFLLQQAGSAPAPPLRLRHPHP